MTDEDLLRRLKEVRHSSQADRIRRRRLTMSDIARETGISRENLQNIAGGISKIGPKTRTALRQYFECASKADVRFHPRAPVETEHGTRISVILDRFGLK
jgi:transcriptional regulator with XRE-family HTH domain